MGEPAFQLDAADPDQVSFAREQVARREARAADLWRWLLTQKIGREFLFTQVLEVLGPFRVVRTEGDVALHNFAFGLLKTHVMRHRDLYLQMVAEAVKRDEEERQRLETAQAEWKRRQDSQGDDT